MAEITRERTGQIIRTVLEVLRDQPEHSMAARDVIAEVARRLPPTEFEQTEYPSNPGVRRFDKIVRFATITPVKAGWLVKHKGAWTGTRDGFDAIDHITGPADLARESVRLYRQWARSRPEEPDGEPGVADEAESGAVAVATLEEAEEAAWSEIARHLQEMHPYEFQDLVAALLRAMGYHITWTAPPGPDQGIDILAATDPLSASGPRIKVQVKRHQTKIGVEGIRSFMATLGTGDIGLFVCTGGFTVEAEREARTQETRRITLLGLEQLVDLWVEHYERLDEEDRRRLPLRRVWFLAPLE